MSFHWDLHDHCADLAKNQLSVELRKDVRSIELRRIEIGGEPRRVLIRLAEGAAVNRDAGPLVNNRYSWRGYGANHEILVDDAHLTFTAEVEGQTVGTITLAVDSPRGLAVDGAFKNVIDGFRQLPNRRICELTKFAFEPSIRSKEVMAALFHIVFVYGHRTHGSTDLFIEVNPRHVRFYEAKLGFARVGSVQLNGDVGAPAQLMWLKVDAIRNCINQSQAGGAPRASRSLYPYFFSPSEEVGIYNRMRRAEPTNENMRAGGDRHSMDATQLGPSVSTESNSAERYSGFGATQARGLE